MKVTGTRKTGDPIVADPAIFSNHPSLEGWVSSLSQTSGMGERQGGAAVGYCAVGY